MSTLEQKIKAIMEAKSADAELLSEESIEELEESKIKMDKDGTIEADSDSESKDDSEDDHQEPDDDDNGGESDNDEDNEDDSDEDTEMSQDTGKKDKAEVKEGADPFGSLTANGGDEAGSTKTSKLKAKQGNKDAAPGKLTAAPSTGKTDDNGDNARLKVGLGKKDSTGKLTGPSAGGAANPDQDRNNVDKNPVGVKEHMTALFNGEELSEEFQTKAATIFEAAVEQVAQARVDELAEEYAQKVVSLQEDLEVQLNEAVEEVRSDLVEQIDGFLNYVVEQWMDDNQVALESGMKVELVNSFIDGMKDLFKEHYVDLPEEKLNIVEEQASEIEQLAVAADELAEENLKLVNELHSLKAALVFESVADSLTDVQKEKFEDIVENVEFTTEDEYQEKLETLKENYFPNGQTIEIKQEQQEQTNTAMDAYVQAVSQNLRFR